jgi:hypothetical protein
MRGTVDLMVEESGVESTRPGATAARRFPVGAVVLGLVVAVVAVWITVAVATHRDPEDTVEAYLDAIADKDVDGALALVSRYGYGVPYGEDAAFLTPAAIRDDWWVVSVAEVDRDYGEARVEAVLAGPGGTAKGEFVVQEDDDEWLLEDPFLEVRFPASPLDYVRVNDAIVPRPDDATGGETYALFPGTYRFYESVPGVVRVRDTEVVAVLPPQEDVRTELREVVPAAMTAEEAVVAKAQDAIERRIDDCAGFATAVPDGDCPFSTDGEIDTPAGVRVTHLHGLEWTVESYPAITLAEDRRGDLVQGFALRATKPGTVTLSGKGIDTDDKPTSFTVTCEIDLTGYLATVDADGGVSLTLSAERHQLDAYIYNTCRRNA